MRKRDNVDPAPGTFFLCIVSGCNQHLLRQLLCRARLNDSEQQPFFPLPVFRLLSNKQRETSLSSIFVVRFLFPVSTLGREILSSLSRCQRAQLCHTEDMYEELKLCVCVCVCFFYGVKVVAHETVDVRRKIRIPPSYVILKRPHTI